MGIVDKWCSDQIGRWGRLTAVPTRSSPQDLARWLRIVTIITGVAWLPLVLGWGHLPHALTYDDAWYYFQIARNVAGGDGSSFDGMNATNGYHPLWLVVSTLPYNVGLEGTTAVRALLVGQLGLYVSALMAIAGSISRAGAPAGETGAHAGSWPRLAGRVDAGRAGWWCAGAVVVVWVLATANPTVVRLFVNGMESGLVALTGALLLALAARHRGDLLAAPVHTTVLLCVAFLSRTDAVFVAGVALLWCVLLHRRIDRRILVIGAVFAVVVLAYMAVNVALVGHPLQISGVSKQVDPEGARLVLVISCVVTAGTLLYAGDRVRRRSLGGRPWRLPRAAGWFGATAWWAAAAALLVGYSRGLATEDYLWHYVPHGLWLIATLGHVVADLAEGVVAERPATDPMAHRRAAVLAFVALPFAVGFASQASALVDPERHALQAGDRAAAEWIASNLPADAVVGSFDAGVIGYFAERPVVNLDGLVNSYEWRDARGAGTAATARFLSEAGVTHLANHSDRDGSGDDVDLRVSADRLFGDGVGDAMVLVHREDYIFSGRAGGISGRRPYATFVYKLPVPGERRVP